MWIVAANQWRPNGGCSFSSDFGKRLRAGRERQTVCMDDRSIILLEPALRRPGPAEARFFRCSRSGVVFCYSVFISTGATGTVIIFVCKALKARFAVDHNQTL